MPSDRATGTSRAELQPILAVDDDAGMRAFLRAALDHLGYPVETAESAAVARQMLRERRFSLVLCDYAMPGENGLELLHYLARAQPDVPVILLTGHDEVDLARKAIANGALDFLGKPLDLGQLSRVIEKNRARMDRDRDRVAALTSEVLTGTIRALVAAVDAKDPYTAQHSERVARLCVLLGRAVGLSGVDLRTLEFAALLHDVGKIAVPESILLKPGELEAGERAIIQLHPVRSAEIVARVTELSEVATIVRHHHESLDGTGYPDGLSGDAIPPLARLLAVADTYEALTADRAYRRAMPDARAREIIAEGIGTQFDPAAARAFLGLLPLD